MAASMLASRRAKHAQKSGVHLEAGRFGTPTPTYYLVASAVAQMTHREINAALYRLAAEVEMATEARRGGWVVVVDRDRACVCLELAEGDAAEAERGMAVLRAVEMA